MMCINQCFIKVDRMRSFYIRIGIWNRAVMRKTYWFTMQCICCLKQLSAYILIL